MKRIAFLFICILHAQFIYSQDIYLYTQESIDSFQVNYPGLTTCNSLYLAGNDITNLEGLNSITTIMAQLSIEGCNNLENLTGLENLSYIGITAGIAYGLYLSNNGRLKNLNGLNSLTTIDGRLGIFFCDSLESVSGIESLTNVGDGLVIWFNNSLNNLNGLSNLTTVGMDGIRIVGNPQLTTLVGLDNIDGGAVEYLMIEENNALSYCHIQSICDYLVSPNGSTNIIANSTGCNSPEEVEEACLTDVEKLEKREDGIVLSPNPATAMVTMRLSKCEPIAGKTKYVRIYNSMGLKVEEIEVPDVIKSLQVDVSKYTDGLYYLQYIHSNQILETVKFIKN